MRRSAVLLVSATTLVLAGCADRPTQPSQRSPVSPPSYAWTGACLGSDRIEGLIKTLFAGDARTVALGLWRQVYLDLGRGDTATARNDAMKLVDFSLRKYDAGQLIGGKSAATTQNLVTMLSAVLCRVGLPPFNPSALDPDGAAVVVTPTSPPQDIVTETQFAGLHVNTGDVPQPTLITITRLPSDGPGPLLTPFDQYPLYYEFNYNPGITFTQPVLVGTCVSNSFAPPDPSRLRLAHNVAPYTWGSIEVLPFQPAPFLDCTNAGLSAAPSSGRLDVLARGGSRLLTRALAALFAPRLLYAAVGGAGGVGGSVRTFSPFGAVDTLGIITSERPVEQLGFVNTAVTYPPTVRLRTPTGVPMYGVPVTFGITAGGGSLTGANPQTDATGHASVGSWTLGSTPMVNVLTATAHGPAGTGFQGNPRVFDANAQPQP